LAINKASFGPDHPSVAIHVNKLGAVLRALGDLAGVRAAFERALQIFEAHLGAVHPSTQMVQRSLEVLAQGRPLGMNALISPAGMRG
jgi:hypothetical protein